MAAVLAATALGLAAAPAQALVIGVTEGVSYQATEQQIGPRFEPIAEALSKALKQPVSVKVLVSYAMAREMLRDRKVDLAFVHPTHVALEAIKSGNYQAVAWTSGYTDYKVSLLCKEARPISDWKSLAGKQLVTPDADSITAVAARAMLRENGVAASAVKITVSRYQDAVPFYVQNGFAAYGATASGKVVRDWTSAGGGICAQSRAIPIKQWLVARSLDAAATATIRDTLTGLGQSDAGKRALAAVGYEGFVPADAKVDADLINWLGL